jgi:tetratricopeptide (TPR) repeat protein
MGVINPAFAAIRRRFAARALILTLAGLLSGCAHLSPLTGSRDVLDPEEHVRLGLSYETQGLREEAAGQYKAAVRRDPACAEGWLALGNMSFSAGRLREAGNRFREALKAAPHHPGASNNLAMVILAQNGSLSKAEALALDALGNAGALRPYVLDTLANVFLRQRRYSDAKDAITQAEAAAPAGDRPVLEQLRETRRIIDAAGGSSSKL